MSRIELIPTLAVQVKVDRHKGQTSVCRMNPSKILQEAELGNENSHMLFLSKNERLTKLNT